MWIKLKCPKCKSEKYIVDEAYWSKETQEEARKCACGEKMEVVAEDD